MPDAAARLATNCTNFTNRRPAALALGRSWNFVKFVVRRGRRQAALLQGAAHAGSSVRIGFVDSHGVASRRIVRPVNVGGGVLEGIDRCADELRRFPLHRITSAEIISE